MVVKSKKKMKTINLGKTRKRQKDVDAQLKLVKLEIITNARALAVN
jgi:hypothetical protein